MSELEFQSSGCKLLEWDSHFFDFPVARMHNPAADKNLMRNAEQWCLENRVRCLYWLTDPSLHGLVDTAFDFEFKFLDVRLELTAELPPAGNSRLSRLRPAEPEDIPSLRRIAAVSHRDSRFCRDSLFPTGSGDRLFEAWIERDVLSSDSMVWMCTDPGGSALGYASCRLESPSSQDGVVSLIAVASEARGRGIGSSLLLGCQEWLSQKGATKVSVVTQGANMAAQRLYAKAGYIPANAGYWFHRWFTGPDFS